MNGRASSVVIRDARQVAVNYLKEAPVAHALFRSAELAPFAGMSFSRPVLELGCGDGQFARLAVEGVVDVGLDICPRKLNWARRAYLRLIQADARTIPFQDESFATVISISALEHMRAPERVAAEVFRVLKPGGTFAGTVALADLHQYLFYPRLFRRCGLGILARW